MAYWVTEQIAVSGATIADDNWRDLVEKLDITAVVNLRAPSTRIHSYTPCRRATCGCR